MRQADPVATSTTRQEQVQMQRPRVPGSLTLGRVLLLVESVLWLLGAVAVAGVGVWFLSAGGALSNRLQQLGYSGANVSAAAGVVGGTVLAFAVVILVISVIGIWSGAAMGRLTTGPRVTGIVLASLGLLLGIVSALGSARTTVHVTTGPSFRGSPIPGIIIIVVNLLIIWALGFSGKTRAAFRSLPPPTGYPAMAPAGYGPPPAYGQPGASDAFPPPPPPPPPPDAPADGAYEFPPPPPAP
jgi:hypothetical protein